jgi:hypothetical protein
MKKKDDISKDLGIEICNDAIVEQERPFLGIQGFVQRQHGVSGLLHN